MKFVIAAALALSLQDRCTCRTEIRRINGEVHLQTNAKNEIVHLKGKVTTRVFGESEERGNAEFEVYAFLGTEIQVEIVARYWLIADEKVRNDKVFVHPQDVAETRKGVPYPFGIPLGTVKHGAPCPGTVFTDPFEFDTDSVLGAIKAEAKTLAANPAFFGFDPHTTRTELDKVNISFTGKTLTFGCIVSLKCNDGPSNMVGGLNAEWELDKSGKDDAEAEPQK